MIQDIYDKKIIFITGKGGVGKSLISAGLAGSLSRGGKRVLHVETGGQALSHRFFGGSPSVFEPRRVNESLYSCRWSGDECIRDYAQHLIKSEKLTDLFFSNSMMNRFLKVAPSLNEISLLGKITSGERKVGPEISFDHIVVDAFSTGHFISLLKSAEGLNKTVRVGPMATQTHEIGEVLRDPKICQYVLVSTLEQLPMEELFDLSEKLELHVGIEPKVIINKFLSGEASSELTNSQYGNYLDSRRASEGAIRQQICERFNLWGEFPDYQIFSDQHKLKIVEREFSKGFQ